MEHHSKERRLMIKINPGYDAYLKRIDRMQLLQDESIKRRRMA